MEPAGIEPATSCLQRARDADRLRIRCRNRPVMLALPKPSLDVSGRSSDGWVAIASRRGSLLAAPDRVALFQERGHTLLRVVRERVVGHHQLAVLVGIVLGAIDLGVESALSRSDRVGA